MGPVTLQQAEQAQGMLLKDWHSATVVGLAIAVAILFLWLMRTNYLRVKDRDKFQDKLDLLARDVLGHVEKSTLASIALARAVEEGRPRRKALPPPKEGE